jgi:hypothetical protein
MVELRNQSDGHANASVLPVGERFDKNLVEGADLIDLKFEHRKRWTVDTAEISPNTKKVVYLASWPSQRA